MSSRRNQIDLMYDILNFCNEKRKVTQILDHVNMSYVQLIKYLEQLKHAKFLISHEKIYWITSDGIVFKNLLERLEE